jgi:hypothetical protein
MKLAFLARYEDAESAPKRTHKHANISKFSGVIPPDPQKLCIEKKGILAGTYGS